MEFKEVRRECTPIYDGKILSVERWTVALPNGKNAYREIVHHKGAAAVVAVNENGLVPMVRQYRVAIGRSLWEIPAGKMETFNEDPLECGKRELREETGLTAKNWRKLTAFLPSPGYCDEVVHLYLATNLTQGPTQPDDDEFLTIRFFPYEELLDMIRRGELEDGKTIAALCAARPYLQH